MKYNSLGNTGIKVSSLCMGTMSFGGEADATTSKALFNAALDAGINFFDTADVYNDGHSETLLGRFVNGKREDLVICSKGFFPMEKGVNRKGMHRKHLVHAVEASLKRLQTDYLDLYFVHHIDETTRMEELLETLDILVRQGKILYAGVSNWSAWQTMKALGIGNQPGKTKIACIQPMYNLLKRQAEVELLPMTQSEGIGAISYSPLAAGLLTGKYSSAHNSKGLGRIGDNKMYQMRYRKESYFETAQAFADLAKANDFHPATLAVAWTAAHPAITAPIISGRTTAQLTPSLKAAEVELSPALYKEITQLSEAPPPATDRLEEQSNLMYQQEKE